VDSPLQMEVISANGEVAFYDLDPAKGIVNIGQHPDNDIVVDSPGVALYHLVLDHRQKPYRVVSLSHEDQITVAGQALLPNHSREVDSWERIQFAGNTVVLVEGERLPVAAPPALTRPTGYPTPAQPLEEMAPGVERAISVSTAPGLPFTVIPPDSADETILTELPEREHTIDVDQTAFYQMTIINGGGIVATFEVMVQGLDPEWVTISPPQVNLYEGGRATVTIGVTPPREPASLAGVHRFALVVTSPNYPGRSSRMGAALVINPFYGFSVGELSPKRQTISWFRRAGRTTIPIMNRGNSDTLFRIEAEDDERACTFEFQVPGEEVGLATQAEMVLEADETALIPVHIMPHARRLIGLRRRSYSFTVTTTLLEGTHTPRAVLGQLRSVPLIGPWMILLSLILLGASTVFFFWPRVTFTLSPSSVRAGQEVTLKWSAFPPFFTNLTLDDEPLTGLDKVERPIRTTTYELKADTWLSQLFPSMSVPVTRKVDVSPVKPEILLFEAQPPAVTSGDGVILSWLAVDADTLTLINQTDGVEESLSEPVDSREIKPEKDTRYVLRALNDSLEDQPTEKPVEIIVTTPVPTPLPSPVINQFIVQPQVITAGGSVNLIWEVSGTNSVSIQPVWDELPASGAISHSPQETMAYVLIASNGEESEREVRQVIVATPEPTPTPLPYSVEEYEDYQNCYDIGMTGLVVDVNGLPLEGVVIQYGEVDISSFTTTTDVDGQFAVPLVLSGDNKDNATKPHTWFVRVLEDGKPASENFKWKSDTIEDCDSTRSVQVKDVKFERLY